jgi:hypothetical protein
MYPVSEAGDQKSVVRFADLMLMVMVDKFFMAGLSPRFFV